MYLEDKFDDLPNVSKNIESKIKSMTKLSILNKFDDNANKNSMNRINKIHCTDKLSQAEKILSENKNYLKGSISKKKEEISKNFELFIKKIEDDTNEHIKNIENLKLTEEEKKAEYIRCIDQLDNIISLSESMKNCIETSEENFLNFISKATSFNNDSITSFLKDKEDDLNKNNIYNTLNDKKKYSEKIFNNLKSSNVKNYIINSNVNELKLNELKINEHSDLPNVKAILLNTNNKDEYIQNKIKKISINNLSKKDFEYIFNKNIKIKKKDPKNISKILPNISENYINDLEINKRTQTMFNILEKEKTLERKYSNKDISKIIDSEFVIIDDLIEEKMNYLKIEFNYPNISIKNSDLTDIKLNELFANVNTLKISSCQLTFEFYNIFENESFDKMTELYLDNCNIVNENFLEIIYSIIKNNNLRNNLKCLSFKENNISCLFFYKYILDGKIFDYRFENLEMIDLSYNNLNYIDNKSLSGLPNVKVIDLSNNNLHFPQDFSTLYEKYDKLLKKKNSTKEDNRGTAKTTNNSNEGLLFQIANNIGLLKGNHINTYLKYLIEVLPKLNYPLKSINLSGLFYKSSCHNLMTSINLNKFQSSLIELDLSFCNITDNEASNIFLNEFRVLNAKKINLSNNKLTDELFRENYLINNSNIRLKMKNTVDYKFIKAAEKIYPDLFEKINIEYKIMLPN